jgi:hypothetical protein
MLASNEALQHVSYPTQVIGKSIKPVHWHWFYRASHAIRRANRRQKVPTRQIGMALYFTFGKVVKQVKFLLPVRK